MLRKKNTLYCFSPPVMILTFVAEIALAAYTLFRYKMSVTGKLVVTILTLLAIFQISEFQVCRNSNLASMASRIGFVAITLLPPLALHLIQQISKNVSKYVIGLSYVSAGAFATIFAFSSTAFNSYACSGNYAIFHLAPNLGGLYFAYYYFWLFVGLLIALLSSVDISKEKRQALVYQIFGYIALLIPTGVVNALNPQTVDGIPSVMCGFAIIYALTLVFGIAPITLTRRR